MQRVTRRNPSTPPPALLAWLLLGLCLCVPALAWGESRIVPPLDRDVRRVTPIPDRNLDVRGIYVQQLTAQNPTKLKELIDRSLEVGLNTFVVDLWGRSPKYAEGIAMIQKAGLRFVPRVIVFPEGGSRAEVADRSLWHRRLGLVEYAIGLGAKDVQLDYIRYGTKNPPSPDNASRILEVISFFRERIHARGARLQIDIFGEVSFKPSTRIGQNISRFAPELDAVCPMLYPSHFEPYVERARAPYETVYDALIALGRQTRDNPIPVYAYIEPYNFRYKMTDAERVRYTEAQLQAAIDAGAQGYYVWSVGNYYDILFEMLRERGARQAGQAPQARLPEGSTALFGPPPPPGWVAPGATDDSAARLDP